jgi:hypothetical protein
LYLIAGFQFHVVTGKIMASHSFMGWRAKIYAITARNLGYYNIDKGHSMFYDGETLKLKILFKTVDQARMYGISLQENSVHFGLQYKVSIEQNFEVVTFPQEPPYVRVEDYETNDFDSPDHSLNSPPRSDDAVSTYSTSYPESSILMIEDCSLPYIRGLKVYRCHIMSIKNHPDEKHNENNVLFLSWPLHLRFDGMVTMGRHEVPQIAIGFSRVLVESEDVGGEGYPLMRSKVEITIESPDLQVLSDVERTLKPGSRREGAKLYTFVHVQDHESFSICLMTRYEETLKLWSDNDTSLL